ncbi:MAG: hypothetical protein LJE68_18500 [Rhodobacter sp.]|nr:hypothetical protein [Rhodobacter sp.]
MFLADALRLIARHGRAALVTGLIAGFALPGLAAMLKPALPAMVAGLVFISALRIGLRAALGSLAQARANLWLVLTLQLGVPLMLVAILAVFGWHGSAVGLAVVLAMSGPSISGGPALTVMLGHDPAPAMRLLILGTAILPLTVVPVFWLTPALGGLADVALAALRLTAVIATAVAAAFALRRRFFPDPAPETIRMLDGLAALSLAIIVVGLMSAVGPTLHRDPAALAGWLALAFAVNFGMQGLGFAVLRQRPEAVPASVIAGNRNIALFLVALPASVTDPVLTFIGCYQVPMYLTPILMRRFYAPA